MKNRFENYDPAIAAGFVASWERFVGKAYRCPAGVWTIGFGTTKGVKEGDTITYEKAWTRLVQDLAAFQREVAPSVTALVTPGQFVAILSLAYNVGSPRVRRSDYLKALNRGDLTQAVKELMEFNTAKVNGVSTPLRGLTNRRRAEASLVTGETNV